MLRAPKVNLGVEQEDLPPDLTVHKRNVLGGDSPHPPARRALPCQERDVFVDNLLVRIHFIIVMVGWIGLAPWEFEFPFPGSLTSTFLSSAKVSRF